MRKETLILLLIVSLLSSFSAACKKGSPTSPEPPAVVFKGSVSSGGQGLAEISVYLSWDASRSTKTNSNGVFEFRGFSGNHFIITPSLPGHSFSPSNYTLAAQPRNDLNFTAQPASYGSMVNEIAADFSARSQSGQKVSLYEHFGKVILIDFSADWCGPCRDEAGHLEKLFEDHKNAGFQIITILISGTPATWANDYKLTFPVLDDTSETLWNIYGEGFIPLNIILDRNMTIRYKEAGYEESTIINTIEKYL